MASGQFRTTTTQKPLSGRVRLWAGTVPNRKLSGISPRTDNSIADRMEVHAVAEAARLLAEGRPGAEVAEMADIPAVVIRVAEAPAEAAVAIQVAADRLAEGAHLEAEEAAATR